MMALHISSFSAMEGTNGNYEPVRAGRLGGCLGTFESGTFPESPVEPQIFDPDLRGVPTLNGLEQVIMELEGVDRVCAAMIKKFQARDGPLTSQSDVSQCSTENTAMKNPSTATESPEKKREKFTTPPDVIDLSEDSSDSGTSRRPDQEPLEEDGQVQSPLGTSLATGITEICSPPVSPPISSLKRQHPDSAKTQGGSTAVNKPQEIISLSDSDDDDEAEKRSHWGSPVNHKAAGVKVDQYEDPLANTYLIMENAMQAANHEDERGLQEEEVVNLVLGSESHIDIASTLQMKGVEDLKLYDSVKRRKMGNGDDVEHNTGYVHPPIQSGQQVKGYVHPSIQSGQQVNGYAHPSILSGQQVNGYAHPSIQSGQQVNGYAHPSIQSGQHVNGYVHPPIQSGQQGNGYVHPPIQLTEQVNNPIPQMESTLLEKPKRGRGRPRKHPGSSQVEQIQKIDQKEGKTGKSGKGDGSGKVQRDNKGKEKAKEVEEDLSQDEVYEEEECGTAEVPDTTEELRKFSAELKGEKVDYEPYVRKSYQEEEDELDDVFNELKTVVTTTSGPSSDLRTAKTGPEVKGACDHRNFDFDEDLGFFCGDCGSVGIEMPTVDSDQQNKSCEHKNYDFTDEAGVYCPDCGKVWRDIESIYVSGEKGKGLRKQAQKVQEEPQDVPQVQLTFEGCTSHDDFRGADLELHPSFKQRLHAHQKNGFKFLKENLVGGRQRSHESIGCVLAHAPGTGKTCLVISFIQSFLTTFPQGKPLILAPKIMLESWKNEFEVWKVQDIPIYRIGGSALDSSTVDGGCEEDEDEEDARLAPEKTTLKEGRALQLRLWQRGRGVLLMSYKLFANLVTNGLGDRINPDSLDYQMSKVLLESTNLVILDEGHLARNNNTQIARALQHMETRRRVLLSGTLFQNNFKELYTLLKLCRDDFMISHPQYGKRILESAARIHGSKYSSKMSSLKISPLMKRELMNIEEKMFTEEIGERLENYVRDGETRTDMIESVVMKLQSLTSSFVDWYPGEILKNLPGLIEYSIHLNLTEFQQKTLAHLPNSDQLKHHMSRQYMEVAVCIHPSLVHRSEEAYRPFSELNTKSMQDEPHKGAKITFVLRLMASCKLAKEKVLIFCSTLDPLTYIEDLFSKEWGWRQGQQILRLDGAMAEVDRQRVIQMFNDKASQSQVLLASTRACKEGITLVGASRVVILDNLDNPSVIRQAVSRAFRIGQKKKVYVYRLVATHRSEEQVFRRTVSKERLSQVLLDPVSTMAKFGSFLQEQRASDVEDELLRKLMLTDIENGRQINVVNRYNAAT